VTEIIELAYKNFIRYITKIFRKATILQLKKKKKDVQAFRGNKIIMRREIKKKKEPKYYFFLELKNTVSRVKNALNRLNRTLIRDCRRKYL